MSEWDWERLEDLFAQACELPDSVRADFLARHCAGDSALRDELTALLRAHDVAAGFIDHLQIKAGTTSEAANLAAGSRFGAWSVIRAIGRGGMGEVYEVSRADGVFEQRAALKLLRHEAAGQIERFHAERSILARLDHPGIARLLDGGVAEDGRPWAVLEYVEGQAITAWCASHGADLKQRLDLFEQVCDAVAYAHRNLIVHRDLKPSNILVDESGRVRLLDFGIAKLIDPALGTSGETTQMPLTPDYCAPEQLAGEPVTTATDVYALGLILYELLSGQKAWSIQGLPIAKAIRVLVEANAPKPSVTAMTQPDAPVPAWLLRGDLDAIVARALRKEPVHRYATVDAFAQDTDRHQQGRTVTARGDARAYVFGRFLRRYKWAVAGVIAIILVLSVGIAATAWQAKRAQAETQRAETQAQAKEREAAASEEVTRFLIDVFRGSDPMFTNGTTMTAKELLDRGAEKLQAKQGLAPDVHARLLQAMGATYQTLALYDQALSLTQQALQLRRANGAGEAAVAESLAQIGEILHLKGDPAQGRPLLEQALEIRRRLLPKDDPALIATLGDLGGLLHDLGEPKAADSVLVESVALAESRFGADATETAFRLDDYAMNLRDLGQLDQALPVYRRAFAIREQRLGDSAETATSLRNLGALLDAMNDPLAALPLMERAIAIRKKVFGATHPQVGDALSGLADVYASLDRYDESERAAQDSLAIFRARLPEDHSFVLRGLGQLSLLRQSRRDFAGAIPLYQELVARMEKLLGEKHPSTLAVMGNLSDSLLHAHRYNDAERVQREVLRRLEGGDGQGDIEMIRLTLALTLQKKGNYAEAVALNRQALDLQKRRHGETSVKVATALSLLAKSEDRNGDAAAAERDYRSGLAMAEKLPSEQADGAATWKIGLSDFLAGHGRCKEALPLLIDAEAQLTRKSPSARSLLQARLLLGYCQQSEGSHTDAAQRMADARRKLADTPGIDIDMYPLATRLLQQGR